jgi:hypothetical protein
VEEIEELRQEVLLLKAALFRHIRDNLKQEAELYAARDFALKAASEVFGVPFDQLVQQFEIRRAEALQKLLEEAEDANPGLGAFLDDRPLE